MWTKTESNLEGITSGPTIIEETAKQDKTAEGFIRFTSKINCVLTRTGPDKYILLNLQAFTV